MHEGLFAISASDVPELQNVNSEICEQENSKMSDFRWVVGNMSIDFFRLYLWQLCDYRNRRQQIILEDRGKLVRQLNANMILDW